MQTGPCLCMSSSCKAPNTSCKCSITAIQGEKQNHGGADSLPLPSFTDVRQNHNSSQVLNKGLFVNESSSALCKVSCSLTLAHWQGPSRRFLKGFLCLFFKIILKALFLYIDRDLCLKKKSPLAIAVKVHQKLFYSVKRVILRHLLLSASNHFLRITQYGCMQLIYIHITYFLNYKVKFYYECIIL